MAQVNAPLHSLNAGEVSRLALARVDLAKMRVAAEQQLNLLPQVLGPAMMRPGLAYLASTNGHQAARFLPFVFSAATTALLELTSAALRVFVGGAVVTRPAVTAAVTNGEFTTDISGWALADESGAVSAWDGSLALTGTGSNYAIRTQQVTVNEAGTEHALRVVITRGSVKFKVGSTSGGDDYITETTLREGSHSLAFTPTGDFHIWIGSNSAATTYVDSVTLEAAGAMSLPTPWGAAELASIRYDQSGDVLFCASSVAPRRIERRSQRSWSIVLYQTVDGPFRLPGSPETTITPSSPTGSITLTASRALFKPTHVGALFKVVHSGQSASATLSGDNQFSSYIRVTGVGASRAYVVSIAGTFSATVTLQRALGDPGAGWTDVANYIAPTTVSITDGLDNQIAYYRIGIKTGGYTSGTAAAALTFTVGSQSGIARIAGYTSPTVVTASVIAEFGAATASSDWSEGAWSDYRGWPGANAFYDGRLWWAKADTLYGSVSDAFESFDEDTVGDAGPIVRSVTSGGADGLKWILPLQRLLAGGSTQEVSIRSSSFDEPLTPTRFTARQCSTRGSAALQAIKVDSTGVFVQRNKRRVFELLFNAEAGDYTSKELTRLKPEMCAAGIVDIAVQRQPDTRLWFVLADGTCAVLTYERQDEVICWTPVSSPGASGAIEAVTVLPAEDEDDVYFVVRRVIGGVTKRFVERLAKQSEAIGGTLNKVADSHVVYSGSATTTITGLSHLEGQTVIVWADGATVHTQANPATVSGGQITLAVAASNVVVGLAYNGRFKSTKLGYGATRGTGLNRKKRIDHVGLVMADVGWKGVRVGRDFTNMTGLAATYEGKALTAGQVLSAYEADPVPMNGGWDTDSRLCIEVQAPYPCTLMGVTLGIDTSDGARAPRPGAQAE